MEQESQEEYEETGQRSKMVMPQNAMKSSAKVQKQHLVDQQKERNARSLMWNGRRNSKRRRRLLRRKERVHLRATHLVMEHSLARKAITHAKNPTKEMAAPSSFTFTEFDPNKPTRKHKAESHH